jgi:hypothetical protein
MLHFGSDLHYESPPLLAEKFAQTSMEGMVWQWAKKFVLDRLLSKTDATGGSWW